MAVDFSKLRSSKSTKPPITVLYGVDGIGKSSLASEWPSPFYLPTVGENPPSDIEMARPDEDVSSLDDFFEVVGFLLNEEHDFQTLIVDSLDGMEPLVNAVTCARIGADSINSNEKGSPAAFGQGQVQAEVEWGQFMDACRDLVSAGIAVVLIAHPEIKRFDSPVTDPYDRYGIRMNKRAAALIREQSDIVGFMNYRVSLKTKEVGIKKTVTHAEGGKERQIHLTEGPGFVAKNRYSMPDAIVYKKGKGYLELSKYFPPPRGAVAPANDNTDEEETQAEAE